MSDKNLWDFYQNNNRNYFKEGYPRQDKIFKQIKKYLPKPSKILEIGFGDGYLLNKLSSSGYDVIGQDLSERNIELTKKQWNNDKINFVLGDNSGRLLSEDNSVDGFIASEVLEHMDNKQLSVCISEIHRVLKVGGYGFITVPAKEDLRVNECRCPRCGEVFHRWGHKQCWNETKIYESFSNFKVVKLSQFFNRYVGNTFLEKVAGYLMFLIRNVLNKFMDINGKSYLIIIQKL